MAILLSLTRGYINLPYKKSVKEPPLSVVCNRGIKLSAIEVFLNSVEKDFFDEKKWEKSYWQFKFKWKEDFKGIPA